MAEPNLATGNRNRLKSDPGVIVNLVKSCLEWLFAKDRRQAQRLRSLPLVAFYWDGQEPAAHAVLNISPTGLYLLTEQRWYPGTVVTMTLQRAKAAATDPDRSFAVHGKVVRSSSDGVGFEFVWSNQDPRKAEDPTSKAAAPRALKGFLKRLQADNHIPVSG